MIVHRALQEIFALANPTDSSRSPADIQNILYGNREYTVYAAAFARDISKAVTIDAFDILADELLTYMNGSTVHTQASFDEWHHSVCDRFINELNIHSPRPKKYGKAQKAFNMAAKYLYCCNDTLTPSIQAKFDNCHIALDGYTYIENPTKYPLSFYRDVVVPWKYGCMPRRTVKFWSRLDFTSYKTAVDNIREFFDVPKHKHTFNEYLRACHTAGILTSVSLVPNNADRILTPFEAEFFLWKICIENRSAVFTTLF
jgi:hypothetical protein